MATHSWKKPAYDGAFRFGSPVSSKQDPDELLADLEREVRQQTLLEFPESTKFNVLWAKLVDDAINFNPARVKNSEGFAALLRIRATALFAKYQQIFTHQADVDDLSFDKTLEGLHKKFADPNELEFFPQSMAEMDFNFLISTIRDPDTDIPNPFRRTTSLPTQAKEHLDKLDFTPPSADLFKGMGGPGSR